MHSLYQAEEAAKAAGKNVVTEKEKRAVREEAEKAERERRKAEKKARRKARDAELAAAAMAEGGAAGEVAKTHKRNRRSKKGKKKVGPCSSIFACPSDSPSCVFPERRGRWEAFRAFHWQPAVPHDSGAGSSVCER